MKNEISFIGYKDNKKNEIMELVPAVFVFEKYSKSNLEGLFNIKREDYNYKKSQNKLPEATVPNIIRKYEEKTNKVKLKDVLSSNREIQDSSVKEYSNVFGGSDNDEKIYCRTNTKVYFNQGKFIPFDAETNEEILMDFKYFKNDKYELFNMENAKIGFAILNNGNITVENI